MDSVDRVARRLAPDPGLAGYDITSWQALFAPAGVPKEIIARLYAETVKALKAPDVAKRMEDLGLDPGGMPPEELAATIRNDIPRLGKIVRDSGAKVLAMSDLRTAVYLPTPQPHVVVYDGTGQEVSNAQLPKPAAPNSTVSQAGSLVTYWTGDSVLVMDGTTLTFRYLIEPASGVPLGPGQMMANKLVIPVTGGIGVYDPANGTLDRIIAVDRGNVTNSTGPIVPGVIGGVIVEQRGDALVALG